MAPSPRKLRVFLDDWKHGNSQERLFMALGGVFLLATLVGICVPVLPQVPFAIIAAYFFSKGNRRIHRWIRHNRHVGRPVRDWEDHRVIRPKLKAISCGAMAMAAAVSAFWLDAPWAIAVPAAFALAIAFVLTRKSG